MKKIISLTKHIYKAYGPYYLAQRRLYNNNSYGNFESQKSVKQRELEDIGIIEVDKLPPNLIEVFSDIDLMNDAELIIKRETDVTSGLKERITISLANNQLQEYLHDYIFPLVQGYKSKEYVMRGNPRVAFNVPTNKLPADHFHIDYGLHQLTLQVLLSDLDATQTHMEYVNRSNNSSWFDIRASLRPTNNPDNFMRDKSRTKIIGSRGKAFLFDAGNGFHRAVVKESPLSYRKVLSINFTAKTHLNLDSDYYQPLTDFQTHTKDRSIYLPFKAKNNVAKK